MVISYLDFGDLQNLSDASNEISFFLISVSDRLWLGPFPPSEKSFILPTDRDADAIVADETVVGLSMGPKIAFFSLETGMLTSEIVVPGVRQFGQLSLSRKFLAVSFRKVSGHTVLVIFDRETETLLYQTVQFPYIRSLKILDSLTVVGSSDGTLGITSPSTSDTSILQDPRQTSVDHLDSNNWMTVVSSESKFIVWIHANKSVAKVISRPGFPEDYSGTQVSLSYPIVVSPSFSFGHGSDIEVWDIEAGTFQYKIESDSSHHCLRYPLLNLEFSNSSVMNTVVKVNETQFDNVRYFVDDHLEDLEEPFDEYYCPKHSLLTNFHHITVGRNMNQFGIPVHGQCTKLIVRSFKSK